MIIALVVENLHAKDGWSRYAHDLAKALSKRGHKIHCLVTEINPEITWCTQHPTLRPPLHSMGIVGIALQWWKTWLSLKAIKPSVLHIVCEPYALLFACIPHSAKTMLTLHGSYAVIPFRMNHISGMLWRRALRNAKKIVTVSAFTKEFLQRGAPDFYAKARLDAKIVVVHNAISLDGISLRNEKRGQGDTRLIVGVGAVKRRKGYVQAVRALATFKKNEKIPFMYEIIGSTKDREYVREVEAEIVKLDMGDCIRIRGVVDESVLRDRYANADLFLLLSLAEGLYVEGFVLGFIEAAARGIPCIGPSTGGCPEAISEGVSGYVCDPQDANVVAKAMRKVLCEGKIESKNCRSWADIHDIETAAGVFEKLYREMQV